MQACKFTRKPAENFKKWGLRVRVHQDIATVWDIINSDQTTPLLSLGSWLFHPPRSFVVSRNRLISSVVAFVSHSDISTCQASQVELRPSQALSLFRYPDLYYHIATLPSCLTRTCLSTLADNFSLSRLAQTPASSRCRNSF
jgi:hypothetical protein